VNKTLYSPLGWSFLFSFLFFSLLVPCAFKVLLKVKSVEMQKY
jgi:hypothetical protein